MPPAPSLGVLVCLKGLRSKPLHCLSAGKHTLKISRGLAAASTALRLNTMEIRAAQLCGEHVVLAVAYLSTCVLLCLMQ